LPGTGEAPTSRGRGKKKKRERYGYSVIFIFFHCTLPLTLLTFSWIRGGWVKEFNERKGGRKKRTHFAFFIRTNSSRRTLVSSPVKNTIARRRKWGKGKKLKKSGKRRRNRHYNFRNPLRVSQTVDL